MNEVFTAIYNKYNNSTGHGAYTNLGGRFYHNIAPQSAMFPYCVYFEIVDIQDVDFGEYKEEITAQFNVFSQSSSATEAGIILSCFKDLFDDCSLTVTNWRHVYMQRKSIYPNNDFDQDPPIQGYSIEYDMLIEKNK